MTPEETQVREARERIFKDGRHRQFSPVAIGRNEGVALREWVCKEHALQTLETGLGYGVATLFICEGLLGNGPNGRHVAVDPFQLRSRSEHSTKFRGRGLQLLEEAGVRHLVDFYPEDSQIVLPRLLADGKSFDLVFLDGNHRFEGVFLDLIYSGRLLKEGGVVFVDDTQLPGVRRAVDFCLTNLGWAIEDGGDEGADHEWIVLRTGSHDVFQRPFADFIDF